MTLQLPARTELWFARCGLLLVALLPVPVLLAGIVPPLPEHAGPERVAEHYAGNPDLHRIGCVLTYLVVSLEVPLFALISRQMLRIREASPVLAIAQGISGSLVWFFGSAPFLVFLVAWLRPDRSPDALLAISDIAWVLLVIPVAPFLVQNVVWAVAIFQDRSPEPLFPRWLGYFNLWVALGFFPAVLIAMFQQGPFAWQGAMAFWVPAAGVFLEFTVWSVMLERSLRDRPGRTVTGQVSM